MATVVTVYWLPIQVDLCLRASWHGSKIGRRLAPCCIHHVNRVNSYNGSATMTAL